MQERRLYLSEKFINILVNLPESGMGYQIVKVILNDGTILHQHKVLNAEILVLEEDDELITISDISGIELE